MYRLYDLVFFFNDTATTEIYTLSLHDALPIFASCASGSSPTGKRAPLPTSATTGGPNAARSATPTDSVKPTVSKLLGGTQRDRKSTRLNSSHAKISYAVFCLKKKKKSSSKHIQ